MTTLEYLNIIETFVNDVRANLKTKGINADDVIMRNLAAEILKIQTGINTDDATAAAADIILGKTAYVRGDKITGNMHNTDLHVSVGIPSSSGVILAAVNGSAGYYDGSTISGRNTVTTKGAATITPGTTTKTAISANTWATGNIQVAGSSNLIPSNIKSGISIFGVTGTLQTGEHLKITYSNDLTVGLDNDMLFFSKSNLKNINTDNVRGIIAYGSDTGNYNHKIHIATFGTSHNLSDWHGIYSTGIAGGISTSYKTGACTPDLIAYGGITIGVGTSAIPSGRLECDNIWILYV